MRKRDRKRVENESQRTKKPLRMKYEVQYRERVEIGSTRDRERVLNESKRDRERVENENKRDK